METVALKSEVINDKVRLTWKPDCCVEDYFIKIMDSDFSKELFTTPEAIKKNNVRISIKLIENWNKGLDMSHK